MEIQEQTILKDEIDVIGRNLLSIEKDIENIKAEEEKLLVQKEELLRQSLQFRATLISMMDKSNIKSLRCDKAIITIKSLLPLVEIVDENNIPVEFRTVVPEKIIPASWKPDKPAIIKSFTQSGISPAGCTVLINRKTLYIKS